MADIYTALLAYTDPQVNRPIVGLADGHVKNYFQHMASKGPKALTSINSATDEYTTLAKNVGTVTGGCWTLTVNIPTQDIVFTTANLAWNAADSAIESAIDTAAPASISAGEINVNSVNNNITDGDTYFTCNGANVAEMPVLFTTTNINISGGGTLGAVTRTESGQGDRPAAQALVDLSIISGQNWWAAGDDPSELYDATANAVGWVDRPSLRVVRWLGKACAVEEGTPYVYDYLETLFPEIKYII